MPFSTYGENIFLLFQTLSIIYGLFAFGPLSLVSFVGVMGLAGSMLFTYITDMLPEWVYAYNMYILIIVSKFNHIFFS